MQHPTAKWTSTIALWVWAASMFVAAESGFCAQHSVTKTLAAARAASDVWTQTGSLVGAFGGKTATLLRDGRVLVVGLNGDAHARMPLDSTELYDPATATWSVSGHISTPRSGYTATLLADGRVLIVGGDTSVSPPNFGRTNSAELYDPVTGTWSLTAKMSTARSGHTATLLEDGKVLVAGGDGTDNTDSIGTAELYDPVTGAWSRTGDLNIPRYGHTATRLLDGSVLVAKGSNNGDLDSTLSDLELYDPGSGKWTDIGDSSWSSVGHTATLLSNGKVLFTGGYTGGVLGEQQILPFSELFDPTTRARILTMPLAQARVGHTATLLPDGDVLIVGGGVAPGSTERFDPTTQTWSAAASLNVPRGGHTATLLSDGRVLVEGGGALNTWFDSAELYGVAASPNVNVGPGFTGAWYDPAQSGHGLIIEVLPDNRLLAAWFTFNPAGTEQAWFTGVGTYSGNTATITDVEQPTGGRWIPNFDPNAVVRHAWGRLSFTFTDCDHGRVDFNSTAGYGIGSMNLTRLTRPAGLACP